MKQAGVFFQIEVSRAKRAENFGKVCTFSLNSSKLRSNYLFSFQKRTNYLFPAFSRSEYLFPKSVRPPSESNGRPLNKKSKRTKVNQVSSNYGQGLQG